MDQLINFNAAVIVAIDSPRQILSGLGAVEGARILERAISRLERAVDAHGGQILDNSGWEITALFADPKDAVEATGTMCQKISQIPPAMHQRVSIRIGAALTLDKASALMACAPANSVSLCSELEAAIAVSTPAETDEKTDDENLSGYPEAFDRTIVGGSLVLRYRDHAIVLDDMEREVTLGRSPECGLQIDDPTVSRKHATIVKDGNCFALIDSSTNGSFVSNQAGQTHSVLRKVHFLLGTGEISLGRPPNLLDAEVIRYETFV